MRRIFLPKLILLAFLFVCYSSNLFAYYLEGQRFTQNNIYYEILNDKNVKVLNPVHYGVRYSGNVVIPPSVIIEVDQQQIEFEVSSIEARAFGDSENLISVSIPSTVTYIGDCCFTGSNKLTNISVASENPSYSAADNILYNKNMQTLIFCPVNKTSINIPSSVQYIGEYAFYQCAELTSVVFGENISTIGNYAFSHCVSLDDIELPENLKIIGNNAFQNCISISSIYIPSSVIEIGQWAFWGCTSLSSVIVPDSLCEISSGLFAGCSALSSFKIPESVTQIGEQAFDHCALTSIEIPERVNFIGGMAFFMCLSLTSVTCYAMEVPVLDGPDFGFPSRGAFYGIGEDPILFVNKEVLNDYKDSYWAQYFSQILSIGEDAGINDILTNSHNKLSIYSLKGILIKKDCKVEDLKTLNKGIYIIVSGKEHYKISI